MDEMDLAERFYAAARDLRAAAEAMQLAGGAASGRQYGLAQQYVNTAIEAHDRAGAVLCPSVGAADDVVDAEAVQDAPYGVGDYNTRTGRWE